MWNVFVPSRILNRDSGELYGRVIEKDTLVLIEEDSEDGTQECGTFRKLVEEESTELKNDLERITGVFVDLRCNADGDIICEIIKNSESLECNLVIFEPQRFVDSYFLQWNTLSETKSENILDTLSRLLTSVDFNYARTLLFQKLQCMALFLFQIIGYFLDNRVARLGPFKFVVTCSSLLDHQTSRRQEYLNAKNSDHRLPRTQLGLANVCLRQLLDTLLGMTIMYLFIHNSLSDQLAADIITWAYAVADYLYSLVTWLMGAPAGLKLNKQLTEFLGHFFLYHIYLWKGYLVVLQPVLSSVLWSASLLGVLGVTSQLCFLRDVLSMMTLHIYCFYVYAARLYQFQVYALSAFWRLFRGKKWNVLRQRLDSVRYNVDQLFLGTLLFTILLFTLPTFALYYVVFTLLRLAVLIAHQVIYRIVQTIDMCPLFSVVMWCLNSRQMMGDVLFTTVTQKSSNLLPVFSLQILQMPFVKLLSRSENPFRRAHEKQYHWSSLIGDLVMGRLIYPWVEVSHPK